MLPGHHDGRKTHGGSKSNLLGDNPSPELVKLLSNELQVTKDTPPCFLFHTDADTVVPVENTLEFAQALRRAGVPFDLHIYEKGGHGMGLGNKDNNPDTYHVWNQRLHLLAQAKRFCKIACLDKSGAPARTRT